MFPELSRFENGFLRYDLLQSQAHAKVKSNTNTNSNIYVRSSPCSYNHARFELDRIKASQEIQLSGT